MLTESRDAMDLRNLGQILAIASLSSPHFDANPFSAESGNVPGFPGLNSPHSRVAAMASEPGLWESAGNSNQVCSMIRLAVRF
jgi:hypothetical protein